MDLSTGLATRGYIETRLAAEPVAAAQRPDGGSDSTVGTLATSFATALRDSEATSVEALTTRPDPLSLVQALAETQLAVETAVTVRDRVVEAYQEILRMPV